MRNLHKMMDAALCGSSLCSIKISHKIQKAVLCGLLAFVLMICNGNRISAVAAENPAIESTDKTDEKVVIVIDPGHGGKNEGTIENGFLEKSMTMTTAAAMYEELCKYDNVEVYMTRTEDVDMSLKERAEFAASVNADFLFSIHYNASLNHELFGSEVWISYEPPYHLYGYQFGCVQMETMQDMGLFLRGIKTRLGDKGTDYYGIIRESVERSVPAVIIEHCHVDEDRDVPFCDTEEKQIAFGKADALSVAKYFGLKSSILGVDYSKETASYPADISRNGRVSLTLTDATEPDVCQIELKDTDYENGTVTVEVSAADYDSMLLYYSYSMDGGTTYSPRQPWPECNIFDGTYRDTFSTTLTIPEGEQSKVIVRAYNLFDLYTESNMISLPRVLASTGSAEAVSADGQALTGNENPSSGQETELSVQEKKENEKYPGTTTFRPDQLQEETESKEVSILDFLKICLVIVVILFAIVLISQIAADHRRRKRRRQHRNDAGDIKRQHI